MDSQKNNILKQSREHSITLKKDSYSQTLISSIHFNSHSTKNLNKTSSKNENTNRKKRENSKKKNESIAFQIFQEEYKNSNPNLSEQELKKNSKEIWKQMRPSLRNIYFSNIENKNNSEKDN